MDKKTKKTVVAVFFASVIVKFLPELLYLIKIPVPKILGLLARYSVIPIVLGLIVLLEDTIRYH